MNTDNRQRRRNRIRAKITGTAKRPRAAVYRSLTTVSVQVIDDVVGKTLVASQVATKGEMTKMEQAKAVGADIAKKAMEAGITHIVFDRGGYQYQGRIKALADSMRENGLKF